MELKIGIDPGLKGAIAAIAGNELVDVYDMPTTKALGKGRIVDTSELAHILRWIKQDYTHVTVYLENVHSMPNQGVASTFTFGRGFGAIEGVLGALELQCNYVTPESWKRLAGLVGKEKDASRTKALSLFPYAELERKKDVDRADAILIAWYGQEAVH